MQLRYVHIDVILLILNICVLPPTMLAIVLLLLELQLSLRRIEVVNTQFETASTQLGRLCVNCLAILPWSQKDKHVHISEFACCY